MIAKLKPALVGSVVAGLAMIGASGSVGAEEMFPQDVKNSIVELIGTGVEYGDRCDIKNGIFKLVDEYPDLAIVIAGFASEQLTSVWRINRSEDCECPAQIATAAATAAPYLALDFKDVLGNDFEACNNVIASALEQTLAKLPSAAGNPRQTGNGVPGPDPLAEKGCRDTRDCFSPEPSGGQSASATGR
jgi:hypothetical protein